MTADPVARVRYALQLRPPEFLSKSVSHGTSAGRTQASKVPGKFQSCATASLRGFERVGLETGAIRRFFMALHLRLRKRRAKVTLRRRQINTGIRTDLAQVRLDDPEIGIATPRKGTCGAVIHFHFTERLRTR